MHLKQLKATPPAELVAMGDDLGVEGASTLRKQDLLFAILKELADDGEEIVGEGTIEVLPDGFGFLRSPEANYLAGPDDIYVSPNQVRAVSACAPATRWRARCASRATASGISRSPT